MCRVSGFMCHVLHVICYSSHVTKANGHSHGPSASYLPHYSQQDDAADLDLDRSTMRTKTLLLSTVIIYYFWAKISNSETNLILLFSHKKSFYIFTDLTLDLCKWE